jgi:hypothetical protein
MPVSYHYGNPADTMGMAVSQLKKYYTDIKSPNLIRMEDAYTRDNINAGGQKKLVAAMAGYPKSGQIGSAGNALTMKALSDTMSPVPTTWSDLIAGQRGRTQEQLGNYTAAAGQIAGQEHGLGYADSLFNDRVKEYADAMAREQMKREWELELNRRKFASEKDLMNYKNSLQGGSGFWSHLLGGLGTLGAAVAAPFTGGASMAAIPAISKATGTTGGI